MAPRASGGPNSGTVEAAAKPPRTWPQTVAWLMTQFGPAKALEVPLGASIAVARLLHAKQISLNQAKQLLARWREFVTEVL